MRKYILTAILSFVLYSGIAQPARQGVVKTVEWNLDLPATGSSNLPLNQYINFKIRSKSHDLSKAVVVVIFEHKGTNTARRSFKRYGDKESLKHIYTIEAKYNRDSAYLEVPMIKTDDELGNQKKVLRPSKFYTFYFIGTSSSADIIQLLETSRLYVVEKQIGDAAKASNYLNLARDKYWAIQTTAGNKKTVLSDKEIDFNVFIRWYEDEFFPFEEEVSYRRTSLTAYINFRPLSSTPFGDSVVHFILRSLASGEDKNDSSKLVWNESQCELYKLFSGLHKADLSSLQALARGEIMLTDLINPLFKPTGKNLASRIDSGVVHLERMKNYLYLLLDNNLTPQTTQPPVFHENRLFPSATHVSIRNFIIALESLQNELKFSRPDVVALQSAIEVRDDELKNSLPFIAYHMSQKDTYIFDFETRNNAYILPIFGYAAYGFQENFTSFTSYTGLHFAFQQLDQNIPFRLLRGKTLGQRLGFETGITIASFKEKGKRENLFGSSNSLFTGLGLKLSHVVTLSAGTIWFRREDPDPFVTATKIATTPYASISLNLQLKKIFESFTSLIPFK